jgi:hypothetical protein
MFPPQWQTKTPIESFWGKVATDLALVFSSVEVFKTYVN